jgi:hypothetical protein
MKGLNILPTFVKTNFLFVFVNFPLMRIPTLAPPKGIPKNAYFRVIFLAKQIVSLREISGESLTPPQHLPLIAESITIYPVNSSSLSENLHASNGLGSCIPFLSKINIVLQKFREIHKLLALLSYVNQMSTFSILGVLCCVLLGDACAGFFEVKCS